MLDAFTATPQWAVEQRPIGIYTYAPAMVGDDAAAMHNCLNTLATNSLCIYTRKQKPAAVVAPGPAEAAAKPADAAPAAGASVAGSGVTSSGTAAQAALPLAVMLACALAPFLF